jgi:hypothetical protein
VDVSPTRTAGDRPSARPITRTASPSDSFLATPISESPRALAAPSAGSSQPMSTSILAVRGRVSLGPLLGNGGGACRRLGAAGREDLAPALVVSTADADSPAAGPRSRFVRSSAAAAASLSASRSSAQASAASAPRFKHSRASTLSPFANRRCALRRIDRVSLSSFGSGVRMAMLFRGIGSRTGVTARETKDLRTRVAAVRCRTTRRAGCSSSAPAERV